MIWRAICASPKSLKAISPIVPLQVRSKSPVSVITCGEFVHRTSSTLPSTKLLAPVIYGIPVPSALYSEGGEITSGNEFQHLFQPNKFPISRQLKRYLVINVFDLASYLLIIGVISTILNSNIARSEFIRLASAQSANIRLNPYL